MQHPIFCDDHACLCTPVRGSQSWWFTGHHRGDVRSLATEYGPLLETSIAQDETADCVYPVGVHLRLVDADGHVELTPAEAERLAATLLDRARAARIHGTAEPQCHAS